MKNLLFFYESIKGDALSQSEIDTLKNAFKKDIEAEYICKNEAEIKIESIKTDARQIVNKSIITLEINKELSKFHAGGYTHRLKAFYNENVVKFMDQSISEIKSMFQNLKSLHLENDNNELPF